MAQPDQLKPLDATAWQGPLPGDGLELIDPGDGDLVVTQGQLLGEGNQQAFWTCRPFLCVDMVFAAKLTVSSLCMVLGVGALYRGRITRWTPNPYLSKQRTQAGSNPVPTRACASWQPRPS